MFHIGCMVEVGRDVYQCKKCYSTQAPLDSDAVLEYTACMKCDPMLNTLTEVVRSRSRHAKLKRGRKGGGAGRRKGGKGKRDKREDPRMTFDRF